MAASVRHRFLAQVVGHDTSFDRPATDGFSGSHQNISGVRVLRGADVCVPRTRMARRALATDRLENECGDIDV